MTTEHELWKTVHGFPKYKVSNLGRVQSLHGRGRLLRQGTHSAGYKVVSLSKNNTQTMKYVHYLVLSVFSGKRPCGYFAAHGDNDPSNNTISNLR